MRTFLKPSGLLLLASLLALSSGANATVACSVVSEKEGKSDVALYALPDGASEILHLVPVGDLVVYPQSDLAPSQAEGWAWIRYDPTQEDIWHSGTEGWMIETTLADCG